MTITASDLKVMNDAFAKAMDGLGKSLSSKLDEVIEGSSGSTAKGSTRSTSKQQIERDRQFKLSSNSLSAWTKTLKDVNEAGKKYRDALLDTVSSETEKAALLEEYNQQQSELNRQMGHSAVIEGRLSEMRKMSGKALGEQVLALRHSVKGSSALATAATKTARASSLLGASLISTSENYQEGTKEYAGFLNALGDTSKELNQSILRGADMIDEATGELRDNLETKDFAELRLRLGAAAETMNESFAGFANLGVDGLQSAISKQAELLAHKQAAGDQGPESAAIGKQIADLEGAFRQSAEQLILQNDDYASSIVGVTATFKNAKDEAVNIFDSLGNISKQALDENGNLLAAAREEISKQIKTLPIKDLAANLGKFDNSINKTGEKLDALGIQANTAAGKLAGWLRGVQASGGAVEFMKGKLLSTGLIMGGLAKAGEGLKKTWTEMSDFNIAQVPASFLDVQASSVKMGMSFEDTSKFLQENKRMLALNGGDVSKMTSGMQETFAKFGYTVKQGAEMVGPALEAGISEGVDVSTAEGLNKYLTQSMESFKDISGIVNMTGKQYQELNADLFNSQDMAATMIGMDQERAAAYAEGTKAARNNYIQMGLSTQMANDLMKAQQAQMRAKVVDKVRDSAKNMALAQQLGMSPEDAAQLYTLGNKKRNTEEQKQYDELNARIGVLKEQKLQEAQDTGGTSAYQAQQVVYESLGTNNAGDAKMQEAGLEKEKQRRAKQDMTPEQARAMGEKAKGNESVAEVGQAVNQVASLMSNGLVTALYGTITALAGFTAQLFMSGGAKGLKGMFDLAKGAVSRPGGAAVGGAASRMMPSLAGNALGGALDTAPGALGRAGGAASKVFGSIAGKLGAVGAVGTGVYEGYQGWTDANKQAEEGKITQQEATIKKGAAVGSGVGTTGGALAGAAAGAAVGSIVPIVGTAIGGILGGLAGAYLGGKGGSAAGGGIASMFASDKKPEAVVSPKKSPDYNKLAGQDSFDINSVGPAPQKAGAQVVAQVGMATSTPVAPEQPGTGTSQKNVNKKSTSTDSKSTDDKETTLDVADEMAHNKLSDISDNMATAVKILQLIADNAANPATARTAVPENKFLSSQQTPTAYSYVTGRA